LLKASSGLEKKPAPSRRGANKNGWQKTLRGHSRPDVNKKSKRTIKRRDRKDPNLQPKEFEAAEWRAQKHTKIRMQFLYLNKRRYIKRGKGKTHDFTMYAHHTQTRTQVN